MFMKKYQSVKIEEENGKIYQKSEQIDGYINATLPRKSHFNNGDFITIFQEALKEIVLHGDLGKGEMKLLMYLIATTGKDNSVCIDLDILSRDLKDNKGNVSRYLKALVERNIVLRQDGYRYAREPLPIQLSVNYDQFNYDLGYKGKISEYKKVESKHPDILTKDGLKLDKYSQTSIFDQIRDFENDKD